MGRGWGQGDGDTVGLGELGGSRLVRVQDFGGRGWGYWNWGGAHTHPMFLALGFSVGTGG